MAVCLSLAEQSNGTRVAMISVSAPVSVTRADNAIGVTMESMKEIEKHLRNVDGNGTLLEGCVNGFHFCGCGSVAIIGPDETKCVACDIMKGFSELS